MWFRPNMDRRARARKGMPLRAAGAALLLASLLGAGPAAEAQAPPATQEAPKRLMRHAPEFWTIPEAERGEAWPVDFEFTIYYYDPHWNLCWGEGDGFRLYLPVAPGAAPALQSGQRVRLQGSIVPARGLDRAHLRITVLDQDVAVAARRVAGGDMADPAHNAAWVELEGVVMSQLETDPTHVEYRLTIDGEPAVMRLQLDSTDPLPQLVGQRIRARGVLVGSFNPAGEWQYADLWTPRRRDITVVAPLGADPRFRLPLTPIERLADFSEQDVRIAGSIQERRADGRIELRDDTGQVEIKTAQSAVVRAGERVEVVGRVHLADGRVELRAPLLRVETNGAAVAPNLGALEKLRMAAQVLELPSDEAARGHPVQVRGVVTWSHPRADFFYVEDASSGVRVSLAQTQTAPPVVGTGVRVEGRTHMGAYAPEVRADHWQPDAPLARPVPRLVTREQVLTGREEAHWVALAGYLRAVAQEDDWWRLDLVTATGEFSALLPVDFAIDDLLETVVRIEGVCAALADAQGRLTGFRLWVPDRGAIEVEQPRPVQPFAQPRVPIVSLQRFNPRESAIHRVRVAGRVTDQTAGRGLFLQDAEAAVEVLTRDRRPVAPGAEIEVVGIVGREGRRPVIREGAWRLSGEPAGPLEAWRMPDAKELLLAADRRLVQLEGRLLEQHARGPETWMTLEAADGRIFEAFLVGAPRWQAGSRLDLTGLYLLERDENGQPHDFTLRVRGPGDVVVVATPPWWNARRLGALFAALGIVAAATLAWVIVLRRQVRRQTEQIRAQMRREAEMQAELERSSRLESLGMMAGGIAHDFNNLLTAILGNLGLIRLDQTAMRTCGPMIESARRATRRAGEITQQLLTFAKGGEPIRKVVALPELVREAADFALHGATVRAEFACPGDLPPVAADPAQISRVVHNLILNAAQAMPGGGSVRLELRAVQVAEREIGQLAAGAYVLLAVSDNGPGIAADELERIFEPYYSTKQGSSGLGLAVVRSIVHRHGGHVDVRSTPGQGTRFRIWLPAAAGAPETPAVAPAPGYSLRRRVLVMDDEEIIRDVAVTALQDAGHAVEAVADGAEAVRRFRQAREDGRPFEVVVLDLTVPGGMGGEQAARELRQIDPAVRLVVSSGYSSNPVMANYRAYGFCAVVPKPYELETLLHAIEHAAATAM